LSKISAFLKFFFKNAKNRTIMDRTIMDRDCSYESRLRLPLTTTSTGKSAVGSATSVACNGEEFRIGAVECHVTGL
jgi:hypothetical protein